MNHAWNEYIKMQFLNIFKTSAEDVFKKGISFSHTYL